MNEDEIINCLAEYDDLWLDRIKRIIEKKIKSNHTLSNKVLFIKIREYLYNLGYYSELINEELNNYSFASDDAILEKMIIKSLNKYKRKYSGEELINHVKYEMYKKGYNMDLIDTILQKNV